MNISLFFKGEWDIVLVVLVSVIGNKVCHPSSFIFESDIAILVMINVSLEYPSSQSGNTNSYAVFVMVRCFFELISTIGIDVPFESCGMILIIDKGNVMTSSNFPSVVI